MEDQEGNQSDKEEVSKGLKDALTEKMIVDGLIKKELLGENQIIDRLGFANIFQKSSSIPSNGMFSDLGRIQDSLQNS